MNISTPSNPQPFFSSPSLAQKLPSEHFIENPGSVLKPVTESSKTNNFDSSVDNPFADNKGSPAQSGAKPSNELQDPSGEQQQVKQAEVQQQRLEQQQIQQLSARDREVRNHERAHAAVGGQYAGAPRYQFERGPDGINYAVGGEVSISAGGVAGDPQATIEKAQVVRRAALAPAEPSAQDRKVAAQATQMESEARVELAEIQREERLVEQQINANRNEKDPLTSDTVSVQSQAAVAPSSAAGQNESSPSSSSRPGGEQNIFNQQQDSLNRIIASSNANGLYSEPGQLLSQIA